MRRSYLDYAMSVIVARALPDVRDGLKPVHRRILYSMKVNGNEWNRGYRKSARIVGDVMGKYHPHGDLAIYDAMVRLAQDFSMRLPLIDGQGNFGSMDGDAPAANRYTEARLARVADSLLDDLDKDTVDFQPNYDETEREPKVLPAGFPHLLVNGAQGIAVGMATNIPPHNLGEVIDACCAYLDNPALSVEELMEYVPAPDFPTGGIIIGRAGTHAAYRTGRGAVVLRAKSHIEEIRKERDAIVFTEMPYQVNKSKLQERIAECVREKLVEGISDMRDESDRDGVRLVVELKRDADPDIVLNQLYRHTALQTSFGVNMLALNRGRPEQMTMREVITALSSSAKRSSPGAPPTSSTRRANGRTSWPASWSRSPASTRSSRSFAPPPTRPARAPGSSPSAGRPAMSVRYWCLSARRAGGSARTAPISCPTNRRAPSSIFGCNG